jgi:hypothetical protein
VEGVTIWVYSTVSHPKAAGLPHRYNTMVSRTHPLLILKEWRSDQINDRPTILWYKRLDEYDWFTEDDPGAVTRYVDEALENYGELP